MCGWLTWLALDDGVGLAGEGNSVPFGREVAALAGRAFLHAGRAAVVRKEVPGGAGALQTREAQRNND